jgi:DmsE family decaheme c-type cytochrome
LPAKTKRKWNGISVPTIVLSAAVVAAIGLGVAAKPAPQAKDAETCGTCHEEVVKAFALRPHATLAAQSCTACHGSGEKHVEEEGKGGIFAFKEADPANEKSKKCLTCHAKDNPQFMTSPHGKASLDCATCHSIHGEEAASPLLKTRENKTCARCHEDIFALFQFNERHRLQEGIMACATCHNPHEPATRTGLAGFKQEECIKCHTDKGGPFLYEHQASRIEGCTICHEVHGSPNRHMLTHQNTADLCFSCHAEAPAWHADFNSEGTNCTTCHSAIHGSNLDKKFLK